MSDEHLAALARRRELPTRMAVAFFLLLTAWALTRSEWSLIWFAAVSLGQAADWLTFRPFRRDPHLPTSSGLKAACTASVAVNAAIYTGLAPFLWLSGGEGGHVFAMVMLCGSLLHVMLHSQQMRRM